MIRSFLVLITSLVFVSVCAHDANARDGQISPGRGSSLCTNESPQIIVKLATAPTKYIKTQNAQDLTSVHNTGRGVTLGLAGGPISITVKGQFQSTTLKGNACVELKKLEVLFWAKPQIHIASNFKKGSCEYREVLGHEQKHIRTLRSFVKAEAPKLKREVRKIVKATRTQYKVKEHGVTTAQKNIEKQIFKRLESYQNRIMPILEIRQKAIDSPAEYKRVAAKCNNWGRKLASNKR